MKVIEQKEREFNELKLNDEGEFVKLNGKSYAVHLETEKEYEMIQHHIYVALEKDIEVYEATGNFRRLEIWGRKVISSNVPIILFSTNDEDKFDSLDLVIKTIMIANKKKIENC